VTVLLFQGDDVLLGTPGMWSWSGGFVAMTSDGNHITEHEKPPTDFSEMAGNYTKF